MKLGLSKSYKEATTRSLRFARNDRRGGLAITERGRGSNCRNRAERREMIRFANEITREEDEKPKVRIYNVLKNGGISRLLTFSSIIMRKPYNLKEIIFEERRFLHFFVDKV